MINRFIKMSKNPSFVDQLTEDEKVVLDATVQAKDSEFLSKELGVSQMQVNTIRANMYKSFLNLESGPTITTAQQCEKTSIAI